MSTKKQLKQLINQAHEINVQLETEVLFDTMHGKKSKSASRKELVEQAIALLELAAK